MKRWEKALGDIRFVGPDIPRFRSDVKYVSDYISKLEAQRHDLAVGILEIAEQLMPAPYLAKDPRCQRALKALKEDRDDN